ncbi:hypothetical protein EDC04DRAFT_2605407 [Pisolithus marmoratus]|nr:hypothetical protein EDC04DRAFT_2605407 [Pisolithus marmoratus]
MGASGGPQPPTDTTTGNVTGIITVTIPVAMITTPCGHHHLRYAASGSITLTVTNANGQSHHKLLLPWDAAATIGYLESEDCLPLAIKIFGFIISRNERNVPLESGEFTTGSNASSVTYRLAIAAMLARVAPSVASVPPRCRVTMGCGIVQTKTEVTVMGPLKGKYNQCVKQRDQIQAMMDWLMKFGISTRELPEVKFTRCPSSYA